MVREAVERDPAARFQTARELATGLRAVAGLQTANEAARAPMQTYPGLAAQPATHSHTTGGAGAVTHNTTGGLSNSSAPKGVIRRSHHRRDGAHTIRRGVPGIPLACADPGSGTCCCAIAHTAEVTPAPKTDTPPVPTTLRQRPPWIPATAVATHTADVAPAASEDAAAGPCDAESRDGDTGRARRTPKREGATCAEARCEREREQE